jgi:hypothetical protein
LLLFGWIDNSHSDGLKHVLHRRGIKFKQSETRRALSAIVKEMDGPALAGLEAEVRVALDLESWTSYYAERKPDSAICELFHIDVLGIERVVKQEMADKQKTKKPLVPEAAKASQAKPGQGTPISTKLGQAELNRICALNCCMKISEEQPVKLCHINKQPYIITGSAGSGARGNFCAYARPALPIEVYGADKAHAYSEHEGTGYEGVKVNVGSKNKPQWWVMTGPEITFTAPKPAAKKDMVAKPMVTKEARKKLVAQAKARWAKGGK